MAEAKRSESVEPAPVASLEQTLDQVVAVLNQAEQTSKVRAFVIEALRLRETVGGWRSSAPPPDVRDEVTERVQRLAKGARDAVVGDASASAPPGHRESVPSLGPPPGPSVPLLGATLPYRESSPLLPPPQGHRESLPLLGAAPARTPSSPLLSAAPARTPSSPLLGAASAQRASSPFLPGAPSSPQFLASSKGAAPLGPGQTVVMQREDLLALLPPTGPAPRPANPGADRAVKFSSASEPPRQPSGDPLGKKPRDAGKVEIVAPAYPPPGNDFKSIPSLRLEDLPLPPRGIDLDRTNFSIPRSQLSAQAISVWSLPQPEGLNSNLVMISDPYSRQADAFRSLRRKLSAGTAKTIAVTSAHPQEGKTTCAVNLALALAEAGPRNILVVEANIRSPGLAALLKFDPPRGFIEQLTRDGKTPRDAWVVIEQLPPAATPLPHQPADQAQVPRNNFRSAVHLLAVDASKERPPRLDAMSLSMGIESLKRAGYEYIILDTPPVLGTMDMDVIGDVVDGILLITMAKKSTRRSIRDAIEQLKPVPVLGVVVLDT